MNQPKKYFFFIPFFCVVFIFLQTAGCKKEYSCEGCLAPARGDTTVITSSSHADSFPACSLCQASDELTTGTWSFTTGNSYICGNVSNCGFIGGRATFTFFGPSACSTDTGLVMTVYLPVSFDEDMEDVTTSESAFYYYDNNSPKDIFIRESNTPFSVTVQHFIDATGLTTGIFGGTVYKADGSTMLIKDGRFKIMLK